VTSLVAGATRCSWSDAHASDHELAVAAPVDVADALVHDVRLDVEAMIFTHQKTLSA
jgi:hypothetical protein